MARRSKDWGYVYAWKDPRTKRTTRRVPRTAREWKAWSKAMQATEAKNVKLMTGGRKSTKKRGRFGALASSYAVLIPGDRSSTSSYRAAQGDVQNHACVGTTYNYRKRPNWAGRAAFPAVIAREMKDGRERAMYACIPKARGNFKPPVEGEACGCTTNRKLAAKVLRRVGW